MTPTIKMGDAFTRHGSDKNTHHAYGSPYDSLFPTQESRDAVRNVLEVGIASGQSVLAWLDIFPNATLVGFDKEPVHNPECGSTDARIHPLKPRPNRLEIRQGNVRDTNALKDAASNRLFDLIVEDSSHQLDDNLRCLFVLWPFVKPGGIYVVEEFENVHCWLNSYSLFSGVEILISGDHKPGELLIVIRKPL